MITGDIVGTGFFYNKTMFDKVGAKVPETWAEFATVQQALKDAKMIPMSISMDLATAASVSTASWTTRIIQDVMYDKKMSSHQVHHRPGGAHLEARREPAAAGDGARHHGRPLRRHRSGMEGDAAHHEGLVAVLERGFLGLAWPRDVYRLWATKARRRWPGREAG